jgi:hypothetical protein
MSEQWSFDDHRRWIEAMVAAGETPESVEEQIAASPLGDEERAALWLVARCLRERPRGRFGSVPPVRARRVEAPIARQASGLRLV